MLRCAFSSMVLLWSPIPRSNTNTRRHAKNAIPAAETTRIAANSVALFQFAGQWCNCNSAPNGLQTILTHLRSTLKGDASSVCVKVPSCSRLKLLIPVWALTLNKQLERGRFIPRGTIMMAVCALPAPGNGGAGNGTHSTAAQLFRI